MTVSPFERAQPDECLSDFALDRLLGDGVTDPHLGACARCEARLRELAAGRDRFLATARPLQARRKRWPAGFGIAAAVLITGLVYWPKDQPDFTLKGGPQLSFYVKHGDQVRRGSDGEIVAPQDAIRFAYSSDKARYLAVLSLDPNGAATVYYPEGDRMHLESAGSEMPLPISTRLDDSLGEERIFALFCERPIDLVEARRTLETRRELSPKEDCIARTLGWSKAQ